MLRKRIGVFALLIAALAISTIAFSASADDEVTQDDLGQFHGKFIAISNPIRTVPLKDARQIRAIYATPDAEHVIAAIRDRDQPLPVDRFCVIETRTGRIERAIIEDRGEHDWNRSIIIGSKGTSFFTQDPKGNGLAEYDIANGKQLCTLTTEEKHTTHSLIASGDKLQIAGTNENGSVVLWDLSSGQALSKKMPFLQPGVSADAYPLSGKVEVLVCYIDSDRTEKGSAHFVLFNLTSGVAKELCTFKGNGDARPTSDGKRVFIFRQEIPNETVWNAIEEWDLSTCKMLHRQPLKPVMASIGLKLSKSGGRLFLHEYLTQPLVVWNLQEAKFGALIGPLMGGCAAFDIADDSKKVVAVVGPWVMGDLAPHQLAIYDVSKVVDGISTTKPSR